VKEREILDNVVGKVVNEAKSEILADLEKTFNEAIESINYQKQEIGIKAAEIPQSKERQAEILNRRIIGGAELKVRNSSLEIVEETVNSVFDQSLKRLSDPSSFKSYRNSLRRYLEEGIEAIGGNEFIILFNSNDYELLRDISKDIEKKIDVKITISSEKINCRGGVQVMNKDKTIKYDNTLESRLDRLRSVLRKEIADIITK
jgi:V/A-type H+-transporting ATPase subunit E